MADAIDNLAQDLNQVGVIPYEYPILTDEGYVNTIPNPNFVEPYVYPNPPRFGLPEQPAGMFDPVLDYGTRQWLDRRMRSPNPIAQDLSNPSTLATGGGMDYNVRDQPVERINIGNTDEQDAFVKTGIGTTLDPKTEDFYGVKGLVSPGDLGGTIGVVDANPSDFAGQIPSVPQGIVTRGEPVSIPGRGLPDYIPIGQMENGDVLYADKNNIRDTIIRPSAYSVSQEDLDKGVVPQKFNFGINTELASSQKIPTPVGSYEGVGATEPSTASVGGFDNIGGNVTVGPDNRASGPDIRAAGPGDTATVYIPEPGGVLGGKPGEPVIAPFTVATPDTIEEVKLRYQGWKIDKDGNYLIWKPFDESMRQRYGIYGQWILGVDPRTATGGETETPAPPAPPTPGGGTPKPPKPGDGGTTPGTGTGAGTGTTTAPGGGQPGGGTPGPGTPLPPREPVTPLVRRETVIPTKGIKEVPLPDRQADPFAKIYADLLANAQQQEDRYRYINYDPDQIMNAAMSGFRRRGAMRSLQGY